LLFMFVHQEYNYIADASSGKVTGELCVTRLLIYNTYRFGVQEV
jgi:hypothetical protein